MYRAGGAAGPESPAGPGRFGMPAAPGSSGDLLQDVGLLALLCWQFQGLQLEREACLASNYALAKENLALRPRLEMGRAALAIKYQELREVAESCADKLQRLEESMHRWSPHCALGWLQAELEEAEQEAEEQMEQLLLGEQSLEAFLPAFQRGRALAHLRRTQAEKLQELLRRRERSVQPAAPTAAADPPKPFPAAAVLPTGAARGPPAVPRSLPPLDSRPVPPLKGSPGCPLGPAPLLSPRPSQPEPPHR
uniref:VPS37D subunit of ESCRT-I n=1 Tax=Ursus americanus TaxID=9643 RepID=A0A452RPK5_URSAM